MARESDGDEAIIEFHTGMCIAIPEYWCTTDELSESWAVNIDLIEKAYKQVIELRGVDVGHEIV